MEEKQLSQEESLQLISKMIGKAKNSYHESGVGPILWGTVITLCSLTTYAEISFKWKLPFDVWILTIAAIVPQIYLSVKQKKSRKVRSYDEQAMDYIWLSFGVSIFLLVHVNMNIGQEVGRIIKTFRGMGIEEKFRFSDFSLAHFLILYGIPTIITGGIMRFRPMIIGGIVCWISSIVSVYTPILTDLLLTAVSATAAWLVPGIILWCKYKKQQRGNV